MLPLKPYSISGLAELYFCTDTIVGWQNVFTSPEFFEIIIKSLSHCREEKGLLIHGYVIMPNHVHTILSATDGNLSDVLRDLKRYTSRNISELPVTTNNQRLLKFFSTSAKRVGKGNTLKVWQ